MKSDFHNWITSRFEPRLVSKFIFNVLQEMVSTAGEKALCGCLYGLFWFLRYLHASGEFKCGYCGNDTKSNSYCRGWNYRSGKIVYYYWTKGIFEVPWVAFFQAIFIVITYFIRCSQFDFHFPNYKLSDWVKRNLARLQIYRSVISLILRLKGKAFIAYKKYKYSHP